MADLKNIQKTDLQALWRMAYPLMLTALSGNLMLFIDRILISKFDIIAMAAVATVGMLFTIFQFGAVSIASIAEVFVGKYNGAKEYNKIGPVIWQMIWFSLLTIVIFVPVGLLCGALFLPTQYHNYGIPYFKVIMIFGPFFPLIATLSSFYIGLGKVKLILISTILANIVNVILDVILIFGIESYIPAMGTFGAALATGIAASLQTILLFIFFIQEKYKVKYQTKNIKFSFDIFKNCLKIGVPNSLGFFVEMVAWAVLLQITAYHSNEHIIVLAAGQTIFLLLAFTSDGLQKSIIGITANIIGGKKLELLPQLIKSAIKLHLIMILCFSIPVIFYPEHIIQFFLSNGSESLNNNIAGICKHNLFISIIIFYI